MKFLSPLLVAVLLFAGIVPLMDAAHECIYIVNGKCIVEYNGRQYMLDTHNEVEIPRPMAARPQWLLAKQNTTFHATHESIGKIKNFLENLNASIISAGNDARIWLMVNSSTVWDALHEMVGHEGWRGQPEWNAALAQMKAEIRRIYVIEWNFSNKNNTYSLFLLRALLELFKDIFRKARGNGNVIGLFCTANGGVHAGLHGSACLTKPEVENNDSIQYIDEWFRSDNAPATAKTHYSEYKHRIADVFNVNLDTPNGHNNQQMVFYNGPAPAGAQWQLGKQNTTKFYGNHASIIKIKNFVEKLHASSINSGRQNVSLGLMKSNDPTVWAQFEEMAINGWDDQPEWNAALTRVKNEIRRDYSLDWAPNVDKRNGGPNNWAYALFLLRALLEFFKEIFNKVAGNVVVIFCTANGVQAGTFGSACLTDLKGTNDANIKLIDEYFKKRCNNRTAKAKYAKYTTLIANFFNVEIVAGGPSPTPYNHDASTILQKQTVNLVLSPAYMDDIMKFIERFHEKLPVNGNNARQTLYTTTDLFKSFLLTINSQWSGQNTMNVAFHRIREFVNTAYGLHQEKRQQFRRKFEENWTYDMFMLRAVFELFKAIIGAIKMVMGPRGSDNYRQILATICPNGLFYHGHMYTSTTPKNCLEALAEMNNENIAKLGEWFTTKDPASTRRGENYQNFQRQNYEDFKTKIDNVFVATVSGAPSLPSPRIQEWDEPVQQLPRVPFDNNLQNAFTFSGGFDANDGVLSFQHEYHPHGGRVQWNYHNHRPVGMKFGY